MNRAERRHRTILVQQRRLKLLQRRESNRPGWRCGYYRNTEYRLRRKLIYKEGLSKKAIGQLRDNFPLKYWRAWMIIEKDCWHRGKRSKQVAANRFFKEELDELGITSNLKLSIDGDSDFW